MPAPPVEHPPRCSLGPEAEGPRRPLSPLFLFPSVLLSSRHPLPQCLSLRSVDPASQNTSSLYPLGGCHTPTVERTEFKCVRETRRRSPHECARLCLFVGVFPPGTEGSSGCSQLPEAHCSSGDVPLAPLIRGILPPRAERCTGLTVPPNSHGSRGLYPGELSPRCVLFKLGQGTSNALPSPVHEDRSKLPPRLRLFSHPVAPLADPPSQSRESHPRK